MKFAQFKITNFGHIENSVTLLFVTMSEPFFFVILNRLYGLSEFQGTILAS